MKLTSVSFIAEALRLSTVVWRRQLALNCRCIYEIATELLPVEASRRDREFEIRNWWWWWFLPVSRGGLAGAAFEARTKRTGAVIVKAGRGELFNKCNIEKD